MGSSVRRPLRTPDPPVPGVSSLDRQAGSLIWVFAARFASRGASCGAAGGKALDTAGRLRSHKDGLLLCFRTNRPGPALVLKEERGATRLPHRLLRRGPADPLLQGAEGG